MGGLASGLNWSATTPMSAATTSPSSQRTATYTTGALTNVSTAERCLINMELVVAFSVTLLLFAVFLSWHSR